MFQTAKKSPKTRRLRQNPRLMISLSKMDNRPVLFIDSGLGGIPYAHFFHSQNRGEKIIYVADRANFPYGPKSKETVIEIVLSLVRKLVCRHEIKILAVVCNAASVSALPALRGEFPGLPIVGTVPAIKLAVQASRKRRIGVLGTQRTIEDPYIAELAARYGPDCVVLPETAAELVDFAERRWFASDREERLLAVKPWMEKFRAKDVDAIVLACTHFLLLLEEFRIAAGNDLLVFDSVEGVSRRIEFILDEKGLRSGFEKNANAPLIMVTGEEALESYREQLAVSFGFTLGARL
jgi:glutamate racemase